MLAKGWVLNDSLGPCFAIGSTWISLGRSERHSWMLGFFPKPTRLQATLIQVEGRNEFAAISSRFATTSAQSTRMHRRLLTNSVDLREIVGDSCICVWSLDMCATFIAFYKIYIYIQMCVHIIYCVHIRCELENAFEQHFSHLHQGERICGLWKQPLPWPLQWQFRWNWLESCHVKSSHLVPCLLTGSTHEAIGCRILCWAHLLCRSLGLIRHDEQFHVFSLHLACSLGFHSMLSRNARIWIWDV